MAKKSLTGMDKIVLIRSTQLFITPELKLILIIIASHMGGHDSICYASVRKLMAECDIRSRKIWDLRIEQLISYNLITKFPPNERYRSNQYEIHFDVIDSIHNGLSPLWRGTKMKTKSVPPLEGEALSPLSLKNPVLCPPLEGGSKERYKEIKEKLLRANEEENKKLTPTDSSVPPGKMSSTPVSSERGPLSLVPTTPVTTDSLYNKVITKLITKKDSCSETEILNPQFFDEFWQVYPRKDGKKAAQKAWAKNKLDEKATLIISDIHHRKAQNWLNKPKQYIPHASTYLNGERWNDELFNESKGKQNVAEQATQVWEHNKRIILETYATGKETAPQLTQRVDSSDVYEFPTGMADMEE